MFHPVKKRPFISELTVNAFRASAEADESGNYGAAIAAWRRVETEAPRTRPELARVAQRCQQQLQAMSEDLAAIRTAEGAASIADQPIRSEENQDQERLGENREVAATPLINSKNQRPPSNPLGAYSSAKEERAKRIREDLT